MTLRVRPDRICQRCLYVGPLPYPDIPWWRELVLWCLFITPGLIYSVFSRIPLCDHCFGKTHALDSDRGRELLSSAEAVEASKCDG